MKTISMDYDVYNDELANANLSGYLRGKVSGILLSVDFLNYEGTINMFCHEYLDESFDELEYEFKNALRKLNKYKEVNSEK